MMRISELPSEQQSEAIGNLTGRRSRRFFSAMYCEGNTMIKKIEKKVEQEERKACRKSIEELKKKWIN